MTSALGGMEWAMETVRQHRLSGTDGLVVMQLGWRDHPSKRTARGIAADLGLHRETVRAAVNRLIARGILLRAKNGVLLSTQVVAASATVSDPENGSQGATRKTGQARPGKRVTSDLQNGSLEKEKIEKGAKRPQSAELGRYARACLQEGKPFLYGGRVIQPDSQDARALAQGHGLQVQRRESVPIGGASPQA